MADGGRSNATKYLIFVLGSETYGLEAAGIEEIVAVVPATRVPGAPDYLRGVIDLRGKIVPVIDLRIRFSLSAAPDTLRTCIVVARLPGRKTPVGLLVDEVLEVVGIDDQRIEPAPTFGPGVDTRFLRGIVKVGEKVVLLLDAEPALSMEPAARMGSSAV